MRATIGLAFLACCAVTDAAAQVVPSVTLMPTTVLAGSNREAGVQGTNSWCYVAAAPSTFQRSKTGPAKITFGQLLYTQPNQNNRPAYFQISGQAQLTFSSSQAGQLEFDYPAAYPSGVLRPSVINYQQTYNAPTRTLTVAFTVRFPGCDVPFAATYQD